MWTAMEQYAGFKIEAELNGSYAHRLENVLTLDVNVNHLFQQLLLWFTPTVSKCLKHLIVS